VCRNGKKYFKKYSLKLVKLDYGLCCYCSDVCTPALFNKAISDKIGSYSSWECWFYRTINQKGMCDLITISLVWGVNCCWEVVCFILFCKTLFLILYYSKVNLCGTIIISLLNLSFSFIWEGWMQVFLKFYYFFAFSFWKPWQYDTVLEVVVSWMCYTLQKHPKFGLKQVFFSSWWKLQSQLRAQKVFFTLLLLLQGNLFSWEHFHFFSRGSFLFKASRVGRYRKTGLTLCVIRGNMFQGGRTLNKIWLKPLVLKIQVWF